MRKFLFASVLVCCSVLMDGNARAQSKTPALAIEHVNVVDVGAGRVLNDQTVVVEHGRITVVASAGSAKAPAGATIVDGKQKYLIPGLWDMHVHAAWPGLDQIFAPLFVANGVTGVREMYGMPFVIASWKQKYQDGEPWPRMIGAGHILDGPHPFWPGSTVVATADEAKQAVDKLHEGGADFIKVYTKLPREAYFAALDEAKRVGTYCAGHVPDAVSVSEASDHGQRSIEHLTGVALECSKEADALRAERAAAAADTSVTNLLKTYSRQSERILATQDPARAADLFARLARNHTWQVPTLTVLRSMSSMNDSVFTADPRVQYMPEEVVQGWDWKHDFRFRMRTPEDWENGKKLFKLNLEIVGAMHRAGVPIMAGTDMLNPYTFPGFSLHDEMVNLTDAGLSPADALRAATLNPAIFMNATDSLGTVEKGKRADLLLLDANPLEDIHNTQKVNAVVLNGRLYDRAALDELMGESRQRARPQPAPTPARTVPASVLGTWKGESICVGNRPACKNEIVVYRIEAVADKSGVVLFLADKIIEGKRVPMGKLEFQYNEANGELSCEFTIGQTHGLWQYKVSGDSLEGTLVLLPNRELARRVNAKRVAEGEVPASPAKEEYNRR